MRYTQYTHKVSIPMRKELYDFLSDLPRGTRTDMGRQFFIYVKALLSSKQDWYQPGTSAWRKDLNRLCRGYYHLYFPEDEEESDET